MAIGDLSWWLWLAAAYVAGIATPFTVLWALGALKRDPDDEVTE